MPRRRKKCDYDEIKVEDPDEAKKIFRKTLGLLYLESEGIIRTDCESYIMPEEGVAVSLSLRVTDKGIRWLRYLKKTERLNMLL